MLALNYKGYDETVDQLQTTLYFLLKEDTNVASFVQLGTNKFNIYDGDPTTQGRIGFPYIVIHTPTFVETRFTQTKRWLDFTVRIELYDKKEKNVRQLTDAVRTALATGESRTKVKGYFEQRIINSTLSSTFLNDESSQPVWVYVLFAKYQWRGCVNVS